MLDPDPGGEIIADPLFLQVNLKSLGALRQKLRKYIHENLEEEVGKFRENPDAEDEEEEEKEQSDDEDAEVMDK